MTHWEHLFKWENFAFLQLAVPTFDFSLWTWVLVSAKHGHFFLPQYPNYLHVRYIFSPDALKKNPRFLVLSLIPTFFCCSSPPLIQGTRAQPLRVLGRQQSLNMLLVWEGILCEQAGCHIWGRPEWWKMAAEMMGEESVSGRQGKAPLLFPSPRSKYHLCESAATWPQGTLLPDAHSPSPFLKRQPNPLLTSPPAVDVF